MTVFALIPVHNRMQSTLECIECLRNQNYGDIQIVVVDDGSQDGTAGYLAQQPTIVTLQGDGGLWWAGAIQMGLDYILPRTGEDDYVLFLNNDIIFGPDLVGTLIKTSKSNNDAAVGSILVNREAPGEIIGIGPEMNIWKMQGWDKYERIGKSEREHLNPCYELSALNGRGTLYPAVALKKAGRLHTLLLPHYGADYEIAARVKRLGVPLVVSTEARVLSYKDFGVGKRASSWKERYFSPRSYFYIPRQLFMFVFIGTWLQRITALPRLAAVKGWRGIKRLWFGIRGVVRPMTGL